MKLLINSHTSPVQALKFVNGQLISYIIDVITDQKQHLSHSMLVKEAPKIMSIIGKLFINSLGPSDAIWRNRSGSTAVQVMACCLQQLKQCWLLIIKFNGIYQFVICCNFIVSAQATILDIQVENYTHWGLVTSYGDIDLGQHWLR